MTKLPECKRLLSLMLSILMIFAFVDNRSYITYAQENNQQIITDTTGETPDSADDTEEPVDQTPDTQPEIPADDIEQTPALNLAQKDGVNEDIVEYTISYNTPDMGEVSVKNGTTDVPDENKVPAGTELTISYSAPANPDYICVINIHKHSNDTLITSQHGEPGQQVSLNYTVQCDINIAFYTQECVDENVAMIGSKGYTSLADALNAVKSNSTITLLDDVEYSGETMPAYPFTITSDDDKHTITLNSDMSLGSNLTLLNADIVDDSNENRIDIKQRTLTLSTGVTSLPSITSSTNSGRVIASSNGYTDIMQLINVGALTVSGTTDLTIKNSYLTMINVNTLTLANSATLSTSTINIKNITTMPATCKIKILNDSQLNIYGTVASNINVEANDFTLSETAKPTIIVLANDAYSEKIKIKINDVDYILSKTGTDSNSVSGNNTYSYTPVIETSALTLTYSNITKKFGTFDEAVDYIDTLNSSTNAYKIVIPGTQNVNVDRLPAKAGSITFESNNCNLSLSGINVAYPLIFNSTFVYLKKCTLGSVTTNEPISILGSDASSIKTLTLNSARLNNDAPLSVNTLIATSAGDEYSEITISDTNNDFTLNAVKLKDKKPIILNVSCDLVKNTELIKNAGSTVLPSCFIFNKRDTSAADLALIKEDTTIKTATPTIAVSTVDGSNSIGNYVTWQDAVNAINAKNDLTTEYKVNISADTEINSLPTKCKGLNIYGENSDISIFIPTTFSQTVPVKLQSINVKCISDNTIPTWKTNGKDLTLQDVTFNSNITGTTTGSLYVTGADISGSVSTFKNVNIQGTYKLSYIRENITSITNLNYDLGGELNIFTEKTMSVTNINLNNSADLIYNLANDTDSLPNVTVSGDVTGGCLNIIANVNDLPIYLASGTKLLTATKATADCFIIYNNNEVTCKIGTGIYVSEKTFALYCGEDKIADYALWSDVLAYINKQTTAQDYTVKLVVDCDINGAFTTPAKTKCTSLTIKSDSLLTLKATSMTLTTDVTFDGVYVYGKDTKENYIPIPISLSTNGNVTFNYTGNIMGSITKTGTTPACVTFISCQPSINGAFNVDKVELKSSNLVLKSNSVIKSLTCDENSSIKILSGKSLTINSIEDGPLNLSIVDDDELIITPQANSTVLTTTDVSSNQIILLVVGMKDIDTYRSGNYIKVAEDKPLLSLSGGSGKSLGTFNSLQDMNTEIARRNDKTANYEVTIYKNIDLTTAFPFPTAGKYNQIKYSPYLSSYGIQVTCGSDIVLTGNVEFSDMKISKVSKTSTDPLPINVSLGAYSLSLTYGAKIHKLTNITGSATSSLHVKANNVEVLGNITGLGTLSYDFDTYDQVKVYGNISVANIVIENDNSAGIAYNTDKTFSISNAITTNGTPLILCPLEYNNDSNDYENISAEQYSSLKVITSAPKITTTSIQMYNDTDLVFYKDGSAIKLGEPVIEVVGSDGNTYKFARFNDAVDFANADDMREHTITLVADVPNAGALKMPADGKQICVAKAEGDEEERTLNFTGSVVLASDSSYIHFYNITLNNNSSSGVSTTVSKKYSRVDYKNCKVNLYAMSGAGSVSLSGKDYTVNGAVSGTLMLYFDNTHVLFRNNVALESIKNDMNPAEIKKINGKLFTVSGNVIINDDMDPFKFNVVDADGTTLSTLKSGTTLLTAPNATAGQFTTDNVSAEGGMPWLITKSGTAIKTAGVAAFAYTSDIEPDVNHQFASFNEAKEYISRQEGNWTIELTENSTGADLTDLPSNLTKIICIGDKPVTLTTTGDINLSADLKISKVIITATSKTVNANCYNITLDNGAKLTAGKALKLNTLTITGSSVVTFTSESEINSISLSGGNIKCPSIVSFIALA